VPQVIVQKCCDITRYRLYKDRASEEVSKRYDEAVAWLTNVSKGIVQLGLDPPPAAGGNDPLPLGQASPRVITRCTTSRFTDPIDPDRGGIW
jgi:phage gp36-like protein